MNVVCERKLCSCTVDINNLCLLTQQWVELAKEEKWTQNILGISTVRSFWKCTLKHCKTNDLLSASPFLVLPTLRNKSNAGPHGRGGAIVPLKPTKVAFFTMICYNSENSINDIRPLCRPLFCHSSFVKYTSSLLEQRRGRYETWLWKINEIAPPNITGWIRPWSNVRLQTSASEISDHDVVLELDNNFLPNCTRDIGQNNALNVRRRELLQPPEEMLGVSDDLTPNIVM